MIRVRFVIDCLYAVTKDTCLFWKWLLWREMCFPSCIGAPSNKKLIRRISASAAQHDTGTQHPQHLEVRERQLSRGLQIFFFTDQLQRFRNIRGSWSLTVVVLLKSGITNKTFWEINSLLSCWEIDQFHSWLNGKYVDGDGRLLA